MVNLRLWATSLKPAFRSLDIYIFLAGLAIGYFFGFTFDSLLKLVLYRLLTDAIVPASLVVLLAIALLTLHQQSLYVPHKRAFQLFFLGVSAMSFLLAAYTLATFPDSFFSGGRGWVTYGKDVVFPAGSQHAIYLSGIVYFIAKTLWSLFVGSLFAVLDRFYSAISARDRVGQIL